MKSKYNLKEDNKINPNKKKIKSKMEIQEKAMKMFLEKGYHATSTSEVCRALHISKPTLYWYFKDKEDLLFSIHRDHLKNLLNPILEEMSGISNPTEKLTIFIHRYVSVICQYPELRLLVQENMCLGSEHSQWVIEQWQEILKVLRKTLSQLKKDGLAGDFDEAFAALSLIGMCTWPYYWFDYSRPEGMLKLIKTIKKIFFKGILK